MAALAAERADSAQIEALEAASDTVDEAMDPQGRRSALVHVVELVADCAGNRALKLLLGSLGVVVWLVDDSLVERGSDVMGHVRQQLLDTIRGHDSVAAASAARAFAEAHLPCSTTDHPRPAWA